MKNNELTLKAKAQVYNKLAQFEEDLKNSIKFAESEIVRYTEDLEKYEEDDFNYSYRQDCIHSSKQQIAAYEYLLKVLEELTI